MDPKACIDRIETALQDGDTDEALAGLVDLAVWLSNGGALSGPDHRRLAMMPGKLP